MRVLADFLAPHQGVFLDAAPGASQTYAEVREEIARFGAWLRSRSLGRGDTVAVAMSNTAAAVVAWFGLLREGVAVVPLNPVLPDEEIAYILRMAEVKMILADASTRTQAARWLEEIGSKIEPVAADERPWQAYQPAEAGYVDPEDIAVIFFTSGTTGRPKGAMMTHRALIANAQGCARTFQLDAHAGFACPIPIFHAFAATVCVFLPSLLGARCYLHPPTDPAGFLSALASLERRRILIAVPSLLAALVSVGAQGISNIEFTVSGGAALPEDLRARLVKLSGRPVYEGYGTTECGPVISSQAPALRNSSSSAGRPIAGVEVEIRSSDGEALPAGETGEIVVRTPALMAGYYDLAAATRASIKGGWFHTGDLGYKSADGEVFILDRLADAITVKGITVLPQGVEHVLNSHASVAESAVVGVPDGAGGEIPWAFVRCRPDSAVSATDLIRFMRERLPIYAVPRGIEYRDVLPKTITGKILKRTLRQKWL